MPRLDIVALAEKVAADLDEMTDDELRTAAKRMVAPFMHELETRGQTFTIRSSEFAERPTQGSSVH